MYVLLVVNNWVHPTLYIAYQSVVML